MPVDRRKGRNYIVCGVCFFDRTQGLKTDALKISVQALISLQQKSYRLMIIVRPSSWPVD
jgi:hypothetical protein